MKPPPEEDLVSQPKGLRAEVETGPKLGKGRGRNRKRQDQAGLVNIQEEIANSLQTQPPSMMTSDHKQSLQEWRTRGNEPEQEPVWPGQQHIDNTPNNARMEVFESSVETFVRPEICVGNCVSDVFEDSFSSETFLDNTTEEKTVSGTSLETSNSSLGLDAVGDLLFAPGAAVGTPIASSGRNAQSEHPLLPANNTGAKKKTKWKKI